MHDYLLGLSPADVRALGRTPAEAAQALIETAATFYGVQTDDVTRDRLITSVADYAFNNHERDTE